MCTTNEIESINADFRITELYIKWNDRPVANWSLVRNQLFMNASISER